MSDLTEAVKKSMGYSEELVQCRVCKFYREEDGPIDRTWIGICKWSKIEFEVQPFGYCDRFKRKLKVK